MAPEYLTDYLASLQSNNKAVLGVLKENLPSNFYDVDWRYAEISRQTYILNAALHELEKELHDLSR